MPDTPLATPSCQESPLTMRRGIEVAVIVPTYNEADNVLVLLDRLQCVLGSRWLWEMVVVDDNSQRRYSLSCR